MVDLSDSSASAAPPPRGQFVASQAAVWLVGAAIVGAASARLAVWAQGSWAPLVIFPLLVGCGIGLLLVGLMRVGGVDHAATRYSGAFLAVAMAVAGQHFFSFLDFHAALIDRRPELLSLEEFQRIMPDASTDFARFMERQAAQGRPVTKGYALRGAAAWASWAFDGLLTLASACSIVYLACPVPGRTG